MLRPSRSLMAPAVLAAAAVALAGCGGQRPDRSFGTFTDCATIGRLSTADDPPKDQHGVGSGAQGDLIGLRLARGHGRLCVEFRTRGTIGAPALFGLALRPAGADRPVLQLQVALLSAVAPEIILKDGAGATRRHLDGTVGIRGDRMSVVVARSVFAESGVSTAAIFDDFRWQARTAVAPDDKHELTDCAVACR